ncbi:hypothetical protein TNCV_2662241 [Trichonephila clavipes]|nr:hypothetical protein TNCV_2662241 [Trichonephila clavipes]
MPPVYRSQTEAHEIHRGKGLDVLLSLAVALSTIQMTVRFSSPNWTVLFVSSEEFAAVEDDNVYTEPIKTEKDVLEFIQSSKISLLQILTKKMKLMV